jgi:hypothetical protein
MSAHETAEVGRAEHVGSARVIQTSTCSAMVRASSALDAEVPDGAFDFAVPEQLLLVADEVNANDVA